MNNVVIWFEIPATDFKRAVSFHQAVLGFEIEEKHRGKVITPKTQINPEMGYLGMFIDTEGNKMPVHSIN